QHKYDIAKAKELLKMAGLTSLTVDLTVSTVAFPGAIEAALLYKDQAARAGITINVVRVPDAGYWSQAVKAAPFHGFNWWGRPTVDLQYRVTFAKSAPW